MKQILRRMLAILMVFITLLSIGGCQFFRPDDEASIGELSMLPDELILKQLPKEPAYTYVHALVLLHDGSFQAYTEEMDNDYELLQLEYFLREDSFESIKEDYSEKAATATQPPSLPTGTVEDYKKYEKTGYREYVQNILDGHYNSSYYDPDTFRLLDRPEGRVWIDFDYYPDQSYNDENGCMDNAPILDKESLVKCYKKGWQFILENKDMSKAVLASVNSNGYKTGKEAANITIFVNEMPDKVKISVSVINVTGGNDGQMYKEATIPYDAI